MRSRLLSLKLMASHPTKLLWGDAAWSGADNELSLAALSRANVLVVGDEGRVANVLKRLLQHTPAAVINECRTSRLRLPTPPPSGRVVVRDVDVLAFSEQQMLFAWLDSASPRASIITTASAPLMPLVKSGAFSEKLYYRLNTVFVDLSK